MLPPALAALISRHTLSVVDGASIDAFLGGGAPALLFFAGVGADRSETGDVAVILPQLLAAFAPNLRGAVIDGDAEDGLKARFGVLMTPSLVLALKDRVLDVFPKILDWTDYLGRIKAQLERSAFNLNDPAAIEAAAKQPVGLRPARDGSTDEDPVADYLQQGLSTGGRP